MCRLTVITKPPRMAACLSLRETCGAPGGWRWHHVAPAYLRCKPRFLMSRMQTPPTSYSHFPAPALPSGAWPPPGGCAVRGPGRWPPPQTVRPSCSRQWSWTLQTGTRASAVWCAQKWSGKPTRVQKGRRTQRSGAQAVPPAEQRPHSQLRRCVTRWLGDVASLSLSFTICITETSVVTTSQVCHEE